MAIVCDLWDNGNVTDGTLSHFMEFTFHLNDFLGQIKFQHEEIFPIKDDTFNNTCHFVRNKLNNRQKHLFYALHKHKGNRVFPQGQGSTSQKVYESEGP